MTSSSIEKKLNELLKAVENISTRIDKIDMKLENFDQRLTKMENNVEERLSKQELELKTKADVNITNDLKKRICELEQQQADQFAKEVMQESYEKRLNILIHELEETEESAWEKREITLQLIQDFMKCALQIKDPSTILLADYHRLPQHPIYRDGLKVNRPVIIKLTNSNDKRLIFSHLNNLKAFNNTRKLNKQKPVYITEHLPKQFQLERKALLPTFKKAKAMMKKTSWRAENGHYCLYVDNVKVFADS